MTDGSKWSTEEAKLAVQSGSTVTTIARRHSTPWRYPEARGGHWVTAVMWDGSLGILWILIEGCSPRLENVGEQGYSYIMHLSFSLH